MESPLRSEIEIEIVAGDVACAADVRRCIAATERPLKGVFHLAGVLEDTLLQEVTRESIERVFAPKALGAWHLHEVTRDLDLDHFVLLSSVAGVFGKRRTDRLRGGERVPRRPGRLPAGPGPPGTVRGPPRDERRRERTRPRFSRSAEGASTSSSLRASASSRSTSAPSPRPATGPWREGERPRPARHATQLPARTPGVPLDEARCRGDPPGTRRRRPPGRGLPPPPDREDQPRPPPSRRTSRPGVVAAMAGRGARPRTSARSCRSASPPTSSGGRSPRSRAAATGATSSTTAASTRPASPDLAPEGFGVALRKVSYEEFRTACQARGERSPLHAHWGLLDHMARWWFAPATPRVTLPIEAKALEADFSAPWCAGPGRSPGRRGGTRGRAPIPSAGPSWATACAARWTSQPSAATTRRSMPSLSAGPSSSSAWAAPERPCSTGSSPATRVSRPCRASSSRSPFPHRHADYGISEAMIDDAFRSCPEPRPPVFEPRQIG